MFRKIGIGCGLVLTVFAGSIGSASAFGPVNVPFGPVANLQDVSFFGRPYPYGYSGWGPCIRYVEVQTRHGVRVRRVRVCR